MLTRASDLSQCGFPALTSSGNCHVSTVSGKRPTEVRCGAIDGQPLNEGISTNSMNLILFKPILSKLHFLFIVLSESEFKPSGRKGCHMFKDCSATPTRTE